MIDKAAAEKGFKTRLRNIFSRNKGKETTSEESFTDIKSLTQHQHKQYRLFTLRFYLTVLDDIVMGKYRNNPCKFMYVHVKMCMFWKLCSYHTVHGWWVWFTIMNLKSFSGIIHSHLILLVRHKQVSRIYLTQAQMCLQNNLECYQWISTNFKNY